MFTRIDKLCLRVYNMTVCVHTVVS